MTSLLRAAGIFLIMVGGLGCTEIVLGGCEQELCDITDPVPTEPAQSRFPEDEVVWGESTQETETDAGQNGAGSQELPAKDWPFPTDKIVLSGSGDLGVGRIL